MQSMFVYYKTHISILLSFVLWKTLLKTLGILSYHGLSRWYCSAPHSLCCCHLGMQSTWDGRNSHTFPNTQLSSSRAGHWSLWLWSFTRQPDSQRLLVWREMERERTTDTLQGCCQLIFHQSTKRMVYRNKNALFWTEEASGIVSKAGITYMPPCSNSAKRKFFPEGTSFTPPIKSTIFC